MYRISSVATALALQQSGLSVMIKLMIEKMNSETSTVGALS